MPQTVACKPSASRPACLYVDMLIVIIRQQEEDDDDDDNDKNVSLTRLPVPGLRQRFTFQSDNSNWRANDLIFRYQWLFLSAPVLAVSRSSELSLCCTICLRSGSIEVSLYLCTHSHRGRKTISSWKLLSPCQVRLRNPKHYMTRQA